MAELRQTHSPTSPYCGQTLGPSEIRLLLLKTDGNDLELQTERHNIDEDIDFDAISYVWGSALPSATVICNNASLAVTPKAKEMLESLRNHKPHPDRLIWIDAICINQDDPQEKAEQIPLMSRIFSQASSVIVWLPKWTPELGRFMDGFPDTFARLQAVVQGKGSYVAWPASGDTFWIGLTDLLSSRWFQRLWTFQEGILSKEAVVLSQDTWINLDKLVNLVYWASFHKEGIPYDGQEAFNLARQTCWTIQMYRPYGTQGRKLQANEVPTLLQKLRRRKVKEQVDRLWAISGLFTTELQDKLAHLVDYSDDARERYWLTIVTAMKIILGMCDELWLLDIPRSLPLKNPNYPSWCPDFQGRGAHKHVIRAIWLHGNMEHHLTMRTLLVDDDEDEMAAKRDAIREHARSHTLSTTDNHLRVNGFQVDTVAEVIQDPFLLGALDYVEGYGLVDDDSGAKHSAAQRWVLEGLQLARRTLCRDCTASRAAATPSEFLMAFWTDHRINEHVETAFIDALTFLESKDNTLFASMEKQRGLRAQHSSARVWLLLGHAFFSTKGGRFGLATPGCKPGDEVCVFYGGESLYLTRPHADSDDNVSGADGLSEFVGSAYVPHLMDQHRSDWARTGPDETYVLA